MDHARQRTALYLRPHHPVIALPGTGTSPIAPRKYAIEQTDVWRLGKLFMRRLRPSLAIFFGFIALVLAFTLTMPKSYTTTVKLIAGNSGSNLNAAGTSAGASGLPNSDIPALNALIALSGVQSAETYVELFQETPVAEQVASTLGLHVSPGTLQSRVRVRPVPNTSIIALSATWSDRQTSARIANEFAGVVVDRERKLVADQAGDALAFLSKQLPRAQKAMNQAQGRLAGYEAERHIVDINAQTQSMIGSLTALDSKIGQVEVDRRQAQAQLANARSQLANTPATVVAAKALRRTPSSCSSRRNSRK